MCTVTHCWRTDKPILYYPLILGLYKITEVKDRMFDLNETINWKPKATGEGRFGNWLKNNDWNLSRSRFGNSLPFGEQGQTRRNIWFSEELYNKKINRCSFQKKILSKVSKLEIWTNQFS
jgi:isoleucyl-tRNA synthetase